MTTRRGAYEANTHVFQDEQDALAALGAIPMSELVPLLACA